MIARSIRVPLLLALLASIAVGGCRSRERVVPLPVGVDPALVHDIDAPHVRDERPGLIEQIQQKDQEYRAQKRIVESLLSEALGVEPPEDAPGQYNVLVLSGGSADGAYQAGIMVGWSALGCRPNFDVICGVSTGALVGALVFPGPEYDCELQRKFTTMRNEDIFTLKKLRVPFRLFLSEGIVDNEPLRQQIRAFATPEYLHKVAAEHARGRRFYVGTTNIDTKRFVVWDMGAIASKGTPESRELYCDVLAASSGITGIFPPTHIRVDIDGQSFDEMHGDGGSTRRLFLGWPIDRAELARGVQKSVATKNLANSNLYVIVAGKIYGDPTGTPARSLDVAFRGISTMLEGGARGELFRLFMHCKTYGMNFQLAAVPPEFENDTGLAQFDPGVMTRLFASGYETITSARPWKCTPPELKPADEFVVRRGTHLKVVPPTETAPRMQPRVRKPAGGPLNPSYLR